MANPFGAIVDNDKLNEMVKYINRPITQQDRAREALNLINEYGKDKKAANYADELKRAYGGGVCTLCLIYNATGDTLYYADHKDWHGFVGRTPYPTEIGNGQWAAFLHVPPSRDDSFMDYVPGIHWALNSIPRQGKGSHGAIVYRGKNYYGQDHDYMVAWSIPNYSWHKNKCYSNVWEVGKFAGYHNFTLNRLNDSDYSDKTNRDGCIIEVDVGKGDSPVCCAILKI